MKFCFGPNSYESILVVTDDDRLIFESENTSFQRDDYTLPLIKSLGSSHEETQLQKDKSSIGHFVMKGISSWRIYHFHDTSAEAKVKGLQPSNSNIRLQEDAGNLAAYLANLKHFYAPAYQRIIETVHLVAPFFDTFFIRSPLPEYVKLEWLEKNGDPDTPYFANMLSDGTLRFICLATLLLQPIELLPDTILIDEPELGLHPYAINILADMIKQVAEKKQVIVSTQSVELLNNFSPEDIIIAEREKEASIFKRLDDTQLAHWLEEYTLGELWKSNVLGGRPRL